MSAHHRGDDVFEIDDSPVDARRPPPEIGDNPVVKVVVRVVVALGSGLAAALSWEAHHHVGWAVFHGFCSWAYVLVYALTR